MDVQTLVSSFSYNTSSKNKKKTKLCLLVTRLNPDYSTYFVTFANRNERQRQARLPLRKKAGIINKLADFRFGSSRRTGTIRLFESNSNRKLRDKKLELYVYPGLSVKRGNSER
jgi:hypothetical protein